jgi:hypothetical protein
MRTSVLFLATKPASVLILKKMLSVGWEIKEVVIPRTYDQSWMPRPTLEEFAMQSSIPIFFSQKDVNIKEVDYVISYMYRNLVKEK